MKKIDTHNCQIWRLILFQKFRQNTKNRVGISKFLREYKEVFLKTSYNSKKIPPVVIEFPNLDYPFHVSSLNPLATTIKQVPVSANTAIHIVPIPIIVRIKKATLIAKAIVMF